ncbi:sugar transferase [Ruegeria sp.]|uniref:sugar transferase n=1 Tax=Ruegeria sp. TaxID=1879320 RepID=UPI00230A62C1|nr:sugar transferase [Ruegeria sp.]MDA7963534.1 sugar transferase [Ruegeria sp.]
MPDYDYAALPPTTQVLFQGRTSGRPVGFLVVKRGMDIGISLLLVPVLAGLAVLLLILNPVLNRGPVLFVQIRMGQGCKPFVAYKFRSMTPNLGKTRRPFDPVENSRITRLGCLLRRSRIDELPQIINVLKGEMSLIGPRPDYIHHARHYRRHIPGYRARHRVRPGISGLAQVEVGYAHSSDAVAAKVRADIRYINNPGLVQEARIFCRTVQTVFTLKGR